MACEQIHIGVNHLELPIHHHIHLSFDNINKEITWLWGSARVTTVGTVSSHHKRANGLKNLNKRIYEKTKSTSELNKNNQINTYFEDVPLTKVIA